MNREVDGHISWLIDYTHPDEVWGVQILVTFPRKNSRLCLELIHGEVFGAIVRVS